MGYWLMLFHHTSSLAVKRPNEGLSKGPSLIEIIIKTRRLSMIIWHQFLANSKNNQEKEDGYQEWDLFEVHLSINTLYETPFLSAPVGC
jgi:hypothetical protein